MATGITELAIVVVIAAALGILAKLLRQPTILAYLATGVVIGYFGFFHFDNQQIFQVFSDLGIMFLLFLVGLEINYSSLRLVGKTSLIVGLAQILFTALIGFGIATLFGFAALPAAYIAIALTFSSTIIVVQLLSEKRALGSLYGKISVGFLLVQDFVAILILIVLAGIQNGDGVALTSVALKVAEGIGLFLVMLFLGRKLFPFIFHKIAHSRELLFLSSLAWLFLLAAVVERIGFSIEIGGFLAGLALANSSEHFEISSKIRPLRDFFIVVFFAILGSSIVFSSFAGLAVPILIFSLFVLIGNPLIVLVVMGLMGHEKRTSFFAGLTVAQISEFSLVVAALGLRVGHITDEVVALITAVGVLTITISTYFIMYQEKIFRVLRPYLSVFERKNYKRFKMPANKLSRPYVLIGCHRTGEAIIPHLDKKKLLIIDFDPTVVRRLSDKGYNAIFGDISDFEIFEQMDFGKIEVIVSTSPNFDDNLTLIAQVNSLSNAQDVTPPHVIVRAETEGEAKRLYRSGAAYVLMPQFISGHYLSKVLDGGVDETHLAQLKKRDMEVITEHEPQHS